MVEIGPLSPQTPDHLPLNVPSAPEGAQTTTFKLKKERANFKEEVSKEVHHTSDFLKGLSHYYQLNGTPEQSTQLSALNRSVAKIQTGLEEGKITQEQAKELLNELKYQPGFPNMNDPVVIQNRISGTADLIYRSNPELVQKIKDVAQKLDAGSITPEDANIEIAKLNEQSKPIT